MKWIVYAGAHFIRLKLGNACYYSVQNLLSSRLLSKNLKIKIYWTIIMPVVLNGCETWSLTLREERRLRVFENRVLRRVFGPKRDEVTGEWRKLHNEELRDLYSVRNIVRVVKSRRMRWAGHVARMGEGRGVHGVLMGKPEGKNHWGDLDVDGRIILRWIFGKWEVLETGWSWLRIGTDGGHLWIRWWTFGFYKVRGVSWLAAEPVSFPRRTLLYGVSK